MAATRPEQLDQLAGWIRRCVQCPLHQSRTAAVPGEGDPAADLMLVGEAPGEHEDRQGRPFVGRSGGHLDKLLATVDLDRADVFITSCVKCRPPANRNPRSGELETCRRLWLERQIELVDPRLVVLMGKIALRSVLGETGNLRGLHGRTRERAGRRYLMTYHPAAAMRFPQTDARMREDFDALRRTLRGRK